MGYESIRNQSKEMMENLFRECGVFWAFSNEQFAEGAEKNPLKEGEKYISIGAGGYMPKGNYERLTAGMKTIKQWEKNEIRKEKGAKEAKILYELNNHECFYTGSIEDALRVLPYTRKEILSVFKKHYNQENERINKAWGIA